MEIEFDPAKNASNIAKHGVDLALMLEMEPDTMLIERDSRKDYRENRYIISGLINERLHIAIVTFRSDVTRIISLRKANKRERVSYEKR